MFAWTQRWALWSSPEVEVIAIPKLALGQAALFRLVHARSYPSVFVGCRLCGPGLAFPGLQVFGASFPFYKTGRPELHNLVLTVGGRQAEIGKIIQVGSALLT